MAEELELREGEEILETVKGDYWRKDFLGKSQIRGKFVFTNKRIIFEAGLIKAMSAHYEWEGADIAAVNACSVGLLIPTGIKLTAKDGNEYVLSLLNRKKYIEYIEKMML